MAGPNGRVSIGAIDLYRDGEYDTAGGVTPQGNYQESEAHVNLLLRRPALYLVPHWIATLALAAVLLVPRGTPIPAGHTITLITGQVVHLTGGGAPLAAAGLVEGQIGTAGTGIGSGFEADTLPGDSFAFPPQAGSAIGTFFDPLLFDATYLEQQGYDDQARADIPVIVAFASHDLAVQAVRQGTIEGGIRLTHAFEYGPYAMGYVSKHGPFISANLPIVTDAYGATGIYLDAAVHEAPTGEQVGPLLDTALPLIGAPAARARGLTGKGIAIAVVDTGIDAGHPDLQGRVAAARDFSSDGNPNDLNGHGTHVAGIAAGTGAASDGKYGGVAPQASLINAKALSRYGQGTESTIIKAMEWAADQGARVINMSLGGPASDGTDPMSREVNAISGQKNVLFVIAAGNSGPTRKVSTPAAADASLAVGAVDKSPALASFSSRGPRLNDMALKPDIVAPGVAITAPRANSNDGNRYATYSGTSMASPMTAGSAALVMQFHPTWSAAQVKQALMSAAAPLGTDDAFVSPYDQGAGLVDLQAIVGQVAYADPAGLSFGLITGDERKEMALAIHNISSEPLVLDLRGRLHGPQGTAIDGLELSTSRLTVPPGESASLRVRVQVTVAGQYSGAIVFTNHATGRPAGLATVGFVVKGR